MTGRLLIYLKHRLSFSILLRRRSFGLGATCHDQDSVPIQMHLRSGTHKVQPQQHSDSEDYYTKFIDLHLTLLKRPRESTVHYAVVQTNSATSQHEVPGGKERRIEYQ